MSEISKKKHSKKNPKAKGEKTSFEQKLKGDDRFASIATDPKYMSVPKQVKKVKVDKRFNKMKTDKAFVANAHKDQLDKVYEFESDEEPEVKPKKGKKTGKKTDKNGILDEDGNFVWNQESSSSSESEHEEAEEAPEDEEEDRGFWSDNEEQVKYGDESGTRLAVQNLDWDHIGAKDLFFLFSSFCKGESMVYKVDVLPSEYGKQQMEKDLLYGPPKAIFANNEANSNKRKMKIKKKEKKMQSKVIDNKVKALEEEENYEFDEMELRKYEAQKMKYFYGVVYCDSPATANHLYSEIDGLEFEQSNLRMDLRFIPDEIKEFPYPPKETCTETPDEYECNFFTNRAFGHTKVKLTWDEDDPKEMKVIKKKLDQKTIEENDFRQYIASSGGESSSEDEEEMLRKRALLGLDDDSESDQDINHAIGIGKSRKKEQVKGDIKVTFKSGFEDIGTDLMKAKQENDAKKKESAYEQYQRERKQKRRERKQQEKEKKDIDKEMMYKKPDEGKSKKKHKKQKLDELVSKDAATKEELELLMEGDETNKEFKPDTTDTRFKAIYDKGAYNMDPTHKEFKKVGKAFLNEHQKRRRKAS